MIHAKTIVVAAAAASLTALAGVLAMVAGYSTIEATIPMAAACAVLAGLLHHWKHAIVVMLAMLDERTRALRTSSDMVRREIGDIHGLVRMLPYTQDLPLPIGGGWALTGDSAALLAREALVNQPSTVLELGSGASTLILGQILRRQGKGRLLSIDHDPEWAERTRRYVEFLGLSEVVSVVVAPMRSMTIENESYKWYDIPSDALERLGLIDLLVVDGPPQLVEEPKPARYPAMPVLRHHLSGRAVVYVDDANRSTEQAMVNRWLATDPGWRVQRHATVDGVCLLARA